MKIRCALADDVPALLQVAHEVEIGQWMRPLDCLEHAYVIEHGGAVVGFATYLQGISAIYVLHFCMSQALPAFLRAKGTFLLVSAFLLLQKGTGARVAFTLDEARLPWFNSITKRFTVLTSPTVRLCTFVGGEACPSASG